MQLGLGSAALLAVGGGWWATTPPGWQRAGFSAPAQQVWLAVGRAVLDGSLPDEAPARDTALQGLLERLNVAVAALPAHAQQELSQLLSLLGSVPGRRWLGGLATDWRDASVPELQVALQDMRSSRVSLRVQAYQALHDLVGAAYFSEPQTWAVLGYPGPMKL